MFPRWISIFSAILATSSLYFFSIGLNGFGPLVWIAPIPLLILAFRLPARPAAIIAFGSFLLGSLTLFSYLSRLMPIGLVIFSLTIPALAFALAVLAVRYAVLHLPPWVALVVFPSAWTAYEYLVSLLLPNGTAGSLAYTQTSFLPLIQLVSITGIWGVTFLLALVPAGIAMAWHLRRDKKPALLAMGVPLALVLSVVIYGSVRLAQPVTGQALRVGLAVTDTTIRYFRTDKSEEALPVVKAYARRVDRLADQGAEIVVLPEKFVGVAPACAREIRDILGASAGARRVFLVAGLNMLDSKLSRNVAVVLSPEGQVVGEYSKMHLVPHVEDRYQPGAKLVEFSVSGTTLGVAICKDMDFPGLASRYARDGVGMLVVPAWDFGADGPLHARMAITRGIEGGFAVVRTAQEGLLSVSDHLGRIIAEDKSSKAPEVLLVSSVRPGPGKTFYSLCGDWVAWSSLLCLVGAFAMAVRGKWQARTQ